MYNLLYVGKLVEEAILTVARILENITFLYDITPPASRHSYTWPCLYRHPIGE